MSINYKKAQEFCATNPAHPALLSAKDFESWCNNLVEALKAPVTTAPTDTSATKPDTSADKPAHKVVIYTDGACSGNPGKGGYAAILMCSGKTLEVSGGAPLTTNNKMELQAVIAGLEAIKRKADVIIRSDSNYIVKNYSYVGTWQANNWRKKDKTPVANIELWKQLIELVAEKCTSCTFEHVAGHSGNEFNELCDKLAKAEIAKI